jgi:ATP-dependent RNA helicase HelY
MDEVHYLADRERGRVWEEVIIHLPDDVQVTSLSATVSNAEEFGEWLETVRGDTEIVVEEHRPVPLWQHVLVGTRLYDLFEGEKVNPQLERLARDEGRLPTAGRAGRGGPSTFRARWSAARTSSPGSTARAAAGHHLHLQPGRAARRRSSSACAPGLRLNTPDEAERVRRHVERARAACRARTCGCSATGSGWTGLQRGFAAHHAGMLPTFKEVVEELFTEGLVKAVFATETLALGINMPARLGGAREAREVERRDARRRHAGGVHAAHRPRRPPRHRRRGPRRRALATRDGPAHGRRASPRPAPTRSGRASGRRTTWRSTSSARSAASRPARCSRARSRSSRPTPSVVGLARQITRNLEGSTATADSMRATSATPRSTGGCEPSSSGARASSPAAAPPRGRAAAAAALEQLQHR